VQPDEQLRVTVFIGILATVYVLAAGTIVRWIRQRINDPQPPFPVWSMRIRRVALCLAAVGIPCFAYGWLVEPYWPEVVHVRIDVPGLPAGTTPIRIAQIADIHSDPTERLEGRLPDIVAKEKPDLIVFTGDAINSREGLPIFRRCLSRIAAIAPTYAVRGNWDSWYFADADLFGGTGARELGAEAIPVRIRGALLWLGGIAVGRESRLEEVLATIPRGAPAVLLYHYPDLIEDVRRARDRSLLRVAHARRPGRNSLLRRACDVLPFRQEIRVRSIPRSGNDPVRQPRHRDGGRARAARPLLVQTRDHGLRPGAEGSLSGVSRAWRVSGAAHLVLREHGKDQRLRGEAAN
jgi:hypothetical protein